jgi:hypothetical protein
VNPKLYWTLWALEVASIVMLAFVLTVPIQDHALPEFIEWQRHPSPEAYRAFEEKRRQEGHIRFVLAAPFLVLAVVLGSTLTRNRKRKS